MEGSGSFFHLLEVAGCWDHFEEIQKCENQQIFARVEYIISNYLQREE